MTFLVKILQKYKKYFIPVLPLCSLYGYKNENFAFFYSSPKLTLISPYIVNVDAIKPLYEANSLSYRREVVEKRFFNIPRSKACRLLQSPKGDYVLLLGCIHKTQMSNDQVKKVLRDLKPDIITIELDVSRFIKINRFYFVNSSDIMKLYEKFSKFANKLAAAIVSIFGYKMTFPSLGFEKTIHSEMDVALEEWRKMPFTSLHPIDVVSDIQFLFSSLLTNDDSSASKNEVMAKLKSSLIFLNSSEIFNSQKAQKAAKHNFDVLVDREFFESNPYAHNPQFTTRNERMSASIMSIVSKRRIQYNKQQISDPQWCVSILGAAHVAPMTEILKIKGYVDVDNFPD